MQRYIDLAYRALFALAILLAALAVAEGVLQILGMSLTRGAYTPGRLLEFSAMVMTFVIALLLRGIRGPGGSSGR
jgi:predicted Kef-type K+ transport protein